MTVTALQYRTARMFLLLQIDRRLKQRSWNNAGRWCVYPDAAMPSPGSGFIRRPFGRRHPALLGDDAMPSFRIIPVISAVLLAMCLGTSHAATYTLDQHDARIDFSVRNLRMFSSSGDFQRFRTNLELDSTHPERTTINVDVDAASVAMGWQNGAEMLRSPDFFDVKRFPVIHFASTEVKAEGSDHFTVLGRLQIRSVSQPLVLDVRLLGRHPDPRLGAEVADFIATGSLQRSAFGMTADRLLISDKVDITIHARIALQAPSRAD
jgi:polyisoprenoid-binding protein YceI